MRKIKGTIKAKFAITTALSVSDLTEITKPMPIVLTAIRVAMMKMRIMLPMIFTLK